MFVVDMPSSRYSFTTTALPDTVEELVGLFWTSSTVFLDAYLLFLLVVILTEACRGRIVPAVFFLFSQFMYFLETFSVFLLP